MRRPDRKILAGALAVLAAACLIAALALLLPREEPAPPAGGRPSVFPRRVFVVENARRYAGTKKPPALFVPAAQKVLKNQRNLRITAFASSWTESVFFFTTKMIAVKPAPITTMKKAMTPLPASSA